MTDAPRAAAKVAVAAVLACRVVAPSHEADPGLVSKADSRAAMRGVELAFREARRAPMSAAVLASRGGPPSLVAEQRFARPAAVRTFALPRPVPVLASVARRGVELASHQASRVRMSAAVLASPEGPISPAAE